MTFLPLILTLDPRLPTRAPSGHPPRFHYGYQLRLPAGPIIEVDDPLLAVFGAEATWLYGAGGNEEAIQSSAFDPGARLRPVDEGPDEDGDPVVAIWDVEALHRAGVLPFDVAERVMAALDHGLDIELVSLGENRTPIDDRRVALRVLVCSPAMVRVEPPANARFSRPARPVRRRVVLLADGLGDLRWWDPAGERGPAEITQLPVSRPLQLELDSLSRECASLGRRADESLGESSRAELDEDRDAFTGIAVGLWRRVRAEIGRKYVVGFLGPDMPRPVWSPAELEREDEEDEEWDDEDEEHDPGQHEPGWGSEPGS